MPTLLHLPPADYQVIGNHRHARFDIISSKRHLDHIFKAKPGTAYNPFSGTKEACRQWIAENDFSQFMLLESSYGDEPTWDVIPAAARNSYQGEVVHQGSLTNCQEEEARRHAAHQKTTNGTWGEYELSFSLIHEDGTRITHRQVFHTLGLAIRWEQLLQTEPETVLADPAFLTLSPPRIVVDPLVVLTVTRIVTIPIHNRTF
jgi:hypothetical protein